MRFGNGSLGDTAVNYSHYTAAYVLLRSGVVSSVIRPQENEDKHYQNFSQNFCEKS
jgi:hypothetical protein